jgi:hypothetical protein
MTAPIPRRRRPRLSFLERKWLLTGRPGAIPYLQNGKWAQSLWREFGEIITERHIARYGLFHRPNNWWRFDAPDPRRAGESAYDYLVRHPKLLTAREKQRLGAQARQLQVVLQRTSA